MSSSDSDDDKRAGRRRRTRLRSGKVADTRNRFIIECAVHDRSEEGARLRLAKNVALPDDIRLFDDEQNALFPARIIWRTGQEVGVHFLPPDTMGDIPEADLAALGRKFYAV